MIEFRAVRTSARLPGRTAAGGASFTGHRQDASAHPADPLINVLDCLMVLKAFHCYGF